MKVLKWLDDNLEKYLTVIFMSVMTVIIFIQVVARKGFNHSLTWTEELARFIFIWLVYIGVSLGCKEMKHLRIDPFIKIFPKPVRPYILILSEVLFFLFACYIAYSGFFYVVQVYNSGAYGSATKIPMWIVNLAPCVGFSLAAIREVQAIIYKWKKFKAGEEF